jgi:hypothetical protein
MRMGVAEGPFRRRLYKRYESMHVKNAISRLSEKNLCESRFPSMLTQVLQRFL